MDVMEAFQGKLEKRHFRITAGGVVKIQGNHKDALTKWLTHMGF